MKNPNILSRIQVAEDMLKNIDKNTRLESTKFLRYAPGQGNYQLKLDGDRIVNAAGPARGRKGVALNPEAKYRESLYQPSMGYCGVFAISYFTGVRFDIVFNYMRSRFNRGGTWQGGTHIDEVKATLDHFGYDMVPAAYNKRGEQDWQDVREFECQPDAWYWCHLRRHWVLMNNGYVIDQTETRRQTSHWCARKKIQSAFQIVRKNAE